MKIYPITTIGVIGFLVSITLFILYYKYERNEKYFYGAIAGLVLFVISIVGNTYGNLYIPDNSASLESYIGIPDNSASLESYIGIPG